MSEQQQQTEIERLFGAVDPKALEIIRKWGAISTYVDESMESYQLYMLTQMLDSLRIITTDRTDAL